MQPIFKNKPVMEQEIFTNCIVKNKLEELTCTKQKLTPARLKRILEESDRGNNEQMLDLAKEMEEQEPHYAGVLAVRKRAITSLPMRIDKINEFPQEMGDLLKQVINDPCFGHMLEDALDALGKGYSVIEIIWQRKKGFWIPKEYVWKDQKLFQIDMNSRNKVYFIGKEKKQLIPQYKAIVHLHKLKSEVTANGGLARLVSFNYMCKNFTLQSWMRFLELFGQPLRLGKYAKGAKEQDIAVLKKAVSYIGSDAAAVIPENMQIEFVQSLRSGNAEIFEDLARWLDEQISKAVLGQTMTSDSGSSFSQAKVHNEVRQDICRADTMHLARTLNKDLIKAIVDINFGEQTIYPQFCFALPTKIDAQSVLESVKTLIPLGLNVDLDAVAKMLNIPVSK